MTSSRLIGRAAELAELEAALRDAADGRPSLAFVAGESGVGKSRLVAELAGRAGARIAIGECVELGDEELPYAPIVSVLRTLARDDDPVLGELPDSVRAELATLLPELGGEARGDGGGTHGQPQLFEALLTLLDQLGREQPFALVLEDIHWADRSTRAFLVFLARSLWAERVLVIATYRSDELHRRHPLRPLLAELERDTRSRRIELSRLSRDELGDLLADVLGGAPDAELLERLYSRSEGNPLFTEELLAARLDGRGGLPSTLRDALMVRIERLSQPAQEVLRVLSAGRVLAHAVLAEASGLDAAEVRAALREAAESNVIVADQRGRYQFRHALLREVVHDDLLPGEHSELHLALARALEHQAAETGEDALITAGIAHHYLQAGAQREALVASVRAADAAERVHAHGEAGALLERALELWPRVPDAATEAGCDRDGLLRRAGRALISDGAYGRAEALLRVAVDDIDEDAEPRRAADLLELLSRAQWSLGRATDSRESLDRAIALLPENDRSPERARILARQAKTAMLQGRFSEALPAAEAAFGAARHAGADGPRADALNAMGHSQILLGEVEDGGARLREAIAISPRGFERTSAWTNLADALHLVGRSQEGLAAAEQGWPTPRSRPRERLAVAHAGRHPLGARRLGRRPRRAAAAGQAPHRDDARLRRDAARGDRAGRRRARRRARVARAHGRRRDRLARAAVPGLVRLAARRAQRRCGDLAAARAAIDDGLDAIEFCSEDLPRIALLSETGAAIEADAAQRARDLGDDGCRARGDLARRGLRRCAPRRAPTTCGRSRSRATRPRRRTSPARAAPPTRSSTPPRPTPGARSGVPTRSRSRSCAGPRR